MKKHDKKWRTKVVSTHRLRTCYTSAKTPYFLGLSRVEPFPGSPPPCSHTSRNYHTIQRRQAEMLFSPHEKTCRSGPHDASAQRGRSREGKDRKTPTLCYRPEAQLLHFLDLKNAPPVPLVSPHLSSINRTPSPTKPRQSHISAPPPSTYSPH